MENLTGDFNHYMYKDSKSFIWISSLNGINKYDGREIKNYWVDVDANKALNEGLVQSDFHEDLDGNLWFSTYNYLQKYNRKTDDFTPYKVDNDTLSAYRLIDFMTDSTLWVQVEDAIFSFNINTNNWRHIYDGFLGINYSIDKNRENNTKYLYATRWFNGNGLLRLEITDDEPVKCDTILREYTTVYTLFSDGVHWVTTNKGLVKINNVGKIEASFTPTKKTFKYITQIKDDLYLLTSENGIYEFESKKNIFTEYVVDFDINSSKLFCFNERELYIATVEEGLYQTIYKNQNPWNLLSTSKSVFSLGQVFFENKEYFCFFEKNGQQYIYNLVNGDITKKQVGFSPFIVNGNNGFSPFLITASDISLINPVSGNTLKQLSYTYSPKFGVIQLNKNILIFDGNGAHFYNKKGHNIENMYSDVFFTAPYCFKKQIIVDGNSYIYVFNVSNDSLTLRDKFSKNTSINQFLFSQDTNSILLLATNQGIKKIDFETGKSKGYILENNFITSMTYDINGDLWAGSRNGLFKVTNKGDVYKYNKASGLPAEVFSFNCVSQTNDGRLWWGTDKGVLYFHPDSIKEKEYEPPMYMKSFKIHGHEWESDTISIEHTQGVFLPYNENTLQFQFSVIDYDKNNQPQYKAFLQGYDVDTLDLGEQSTITYPNLKPGKYIFKYSACTLSGICRSKYNSFEVTIQPPFWQTWWFKLLVSLISIGIIYSGIKIYINNRLRAQKFAFEKQELILKNELQLQQERNRIADELHDELGGKLSTIKFAGKKIQKTTSIDEAKTITKRISEISTELIDSMRSIIWAMDSQNDTLKSLLANIRQYGATLAVDNDFVITFDFPKIENSIVVKGQIRHHLYLTVKEILNNILKHSSQDQVWIKAKVLNNGLEIVISENGKGFDPHEKTGKGKGLKNIQKRIQLLNGTLEYSNDGNMKISIIVPLVN